MRNLRHLVGLAGGLVLAAGPAIAGAQDTPEGVRPYRFTVSGHLANYWLDRGEGGDRASVGGYGVRVMFNRSDVARAARTFFDRASAGAFATFTAEQDGVSTQNLGGQVDVSLFSAPVARGFLDPFISLGAGVLRSSYENDRIEATTDFAITPAAGTRIPFFSGLGFRGDLRAPIVFSDGNTQVNFLAEGGIYISF
jgi:hypothetical protein